MDQFYWHYSHQADLPGREVLRGASRTFLSAVGAVGEKPCFCDGSRSGIAGISGPDDGGLCPCGDVGQRHVDSGCSGDLDSLFRLLRGPLPSFRKIPTRRELLTFMLLRATL